MKARISGLGMWLPEAIRDNSAWPSEFLDRARQPDSRELVDFDESKFCAEDRIALRYFKSEAGNPFLGTRHRRVAAENITAPESEAIAAKQALEEAGVEPNEVDVIISGALVPERIMPPSAAQVAHLIGAKNAYAIGMDAACATTLTQLDMAGALIESGRARHVLLTQSHLMTRTFALMHPASPNVGDAATAFVVSASEQAGIIKSHARTHGEFYNAVTWCRGKDSDTPWWQAGPDFYLGSQNSSQAQELIRQTIRIAADTIREVCVLANVDIADVKVLASVQPRRWVPGAIAEALSGTMYAPDTFEDYAHLGGSGVIANLLRARDAGKLVPGSVTALYAQGAGFTRAAALVRW